MLSKAPLTPSYTQAWKWGLPPLLWLWHDAVMGEGRQWHRCVVRKEPSANQITTQDVSPLRDPYRREKVAFFLTQMLLALWKEHLSHKTFLLAVAGIPSSNALEKREIAELYPRPWCAALHSQLLLMDLIFVLKKGYTSNSVYNALHWEITEHYQWDYNRNLYRNRKIQQFDLADGCVIRSQYPDCY